MKQTNRRVATSEAVVKNLGPAFGFGSLAKISRPLSKVKTKALLYWPSRHLRTLLPSTKQRSVDVGIDMGQDRHLQDFAPLPAALMAISISSIGLNLRYRMAKFCASFAFKITSQIQCLLGVMGIRTEIDIEYVHRAHLQT